MRADKIVLRDMGDLGIHRARLLCIAKVTAAVLSSGRMALTLVGRALAGTAKPKHAIKCVDRLLGNGHLLKDIDLLHQWLARLLPRCERPILLIDWTDIGPLWTALVVTLVSKGRGTAFCWQVHPRNKENNPRVESSLLKKLTTLVPQGCKPILISDAGFRGPWLQKVLDQGWDFVGRVRGRVRVQRGGQGIWCCVKHLWKDVTSRPRDFGTHLLARYLPVQARLIGVWKNKRNAAKPLPRLARRRKKAIRSAREPWILATSLVTESPREVVKLYSLRMRIELMFRDHKCPRFGLALDQIRTRSRHRVQAYLFLATLAHYVAMVVGKTAEQRGAHRDYQANTAKRRVLSWARLGREILLRLNRHPPGRLAAIPPPIQAATLFVGIL